MRSVRLRATAPVLLALLMCSGAARAELEIKGCPSVYPIAFDLSLEFAKKGGVAARVQPMVTNLAVKAVREGTLEIGMMSRPLTDEEKAAGLRDLLLASEGLTLFVDRNNPVEGLTRQEVGQMMRGELRNWSDLSLSGGASGPIAVMHHRAECGVRMAAGMRFLGDVKAAMVEGEAATSCPKVIAAVMDNPRGLGYGPRIMIMNIPKIRALSIDGVKADPEGIRSGKYPYSFGLRLVYRGQPSRNAESFLAFVRSEEAKKLIAEKGYILPE